MRPDAEPRSTQSSPTPTPSAYPAAAAPKKRGAGRKVLAGVGAAVLVVGSATAGLAGGVVHGGASLQPLDEGIATNTAREPAEAAATEEPRERVELLAMSVQVPEGWAAETVTGSFSELVDGREDTVTAEWLTLYPEGQEACDGEWHWMNTSSGCAHLKVLGPEGLRLAAGGFPLTLEGVGPHSSFRPGFDPGSCAEGVPTHTESDPGFRGLDQWEVTEDKAGEKAAGYAEGSTACMDPETGAIVYVDQRLWLVEEEEILFVDAYGLDAAESVVASAEW
ncbi:hypothetical protein DFP74_2998 [Nocardiopsis sp. Huas11]|uniref:hypothetical protein n=1 Tax=Nocardiopsis sp. Huas11 TaxID=2183912 RepID=UPI000EB50D8A|nr:hypothetical protein [Nocardiopsis sp. Huas11]RKS07332.1 hypothetical protein DFP74_2998 [Nocardiopsis sp. Huas11]